MRQTVLAAAVELLKDAGPSEVTPTRVAAETGVARTTIYRHWPDQPALLLATVETIVSPTYEPPETGDVAADLRTALQQLRTRLVVRPVRETYAALVNHAVRDEAFTTALRTFVAGITNPTLRVLEAAEARGELRDGVDCVRANTVLTGPLFHQHLVRCESIDDELIEEMVAQFVDRYRAA